MSGGLVDVYGLSRLSTSGGAPESPVAATYLDDGLGSVSAVLDSSGAVSASYRYSPWGETVGAGELPAYGYNAEESTAAAGLQYLRARWYDPGSASFASVDTYLGSAFDPASLNRYAYAQGNPLANADPTGHESRSTRGETAAWVRKASCNPRRGVGAKGRTALSALVSAVHSRARALSPRTAPLWGSRMDPGLRAASSPYAPLGRGAKSVAVKRTALSRAAGSSARATVRASKARGIYYYAQRERERQARLMCERLPYFGGGPKRGEGDAHAFLDVAGAFDPTPVSDGANAILYGLEGDAANAAISVAAMVPYAGDAAKAGRAVAKAGAAAAEGAGDAAQAVTTTIAKREPKASDPVGRWSLPLNGNYREKELQRSHRNDPAVINGRLYSDHALDRMQDRGFVPSMVEEVIAHGRSRPDPGFSDRTQYYDPDAKVKVVLETGTGKIISVMKDSTGF